MYFENDLIKAHRDGTLELDCPQVELRQEGTETPRTLSGPGYIRQDEVGILEFRVFVTHASDMPDPLVDLEGMVVGTLAPDTHYYSLLARDQYSRSWSASRVSIDTNMGATQDGRQVLVATGKMREIQYRRDRAGKETGQAMAMYFFEDFECPWFLATTIEKRITEKYKTSGFALNAALLPMEGYELLIRKEEEFGIILEANSTSALPPLLDIRLTESFLFVLAHSPWPGVIQLYDQAHESLRLISKIPPRSSSPFMPPVQINALPSRNWFWVLFATYLDYLIKQNHDSWHPCSRFLHSIVTAGRGSFHSGALALGVAVEGLSRVLFPSIGKPSTEFVDCLDELISYASKWGPNDTRPAAEELRKRVPGLLGQLKSVGAKDRLYYLARRDWIAGELIDKWGALRNRTAHGSMPGVRVEQAFLDLFHSVTELLYQLIFCAISYRGIYTAHSRRNFPPAYYPTEDLRKRCHGRIQEVAFTKWISRGGTHGDDLGDWFAAEAEVFAFERSLLGSS